MTSGRLWSIFVRLRSLARSAEGCFPRQTQPLFGYIFKKGAKKFITILLRPPYSNDQYVVEVSPTLGSGITPWTTTGVTITNAQLVDGKRTVTATANVSGERQFMRLRVVRNQPGRIMPLTTQIA